MIKTQNSQFNRNLLIGMALLFVLAMVIVAYPMVAAESGITAWWMLPLNLLILSIPLLLVVGAIYVLIRGWHERSTLGSISPRLAKVIHWAPRIAAIVIIFFISLFSLDVFEMGVPFPQVLGAFLMHNIPSLILLLLLVLAWKRPAIGFVSFLIAGILFAAFFVRELDDLPNLLLFVLPILLVAALFYADWKALQTT